MTTILNIAGHGRRRNGTFDPGATGYIKMGEHRYFTEMLFPAMKRYLPKNSGMVFHTDYNVYDYGNIVNLAKQYGPDTIVVEWHFDAFVESATGGHVIVYKGYEPDAIDLALRDVIAKNIGVRYSHRGHKGISGRSNLANVNRTANGGINYRLVEVGFGTNKKDADYMLNNYEKLAHDFVDALVGTTVKPKPVDKRIGVNTKAEEPLSKYTDQQLADMVMQGEFGNGDDRKKALGKRYDPVQKIVNQKAKRPEPSIDQLVKETLAGKHGNGDARRASLGKYYDPVQTEINRIYSANKRKSDEQMAQEVIDGKHGNNPQRRNKLLSMGYNYDNIQRIVNRKLA